MNSLWIDVQPGDLGFTKGGGLVGWIIRHGTGSAYAHTFIYHKLISSDKNGNQVWETVEAWPSKKAAFDGVRVRIRQEAPDKVVRVWRTKSEQEAILTKSSSLIGTRYGWGEIARIGLRFVGIKVAGWESDERMICSNHCTQSVLAARPELSVFFRFKPSMVWPGELATVTDAIVWAQDRIQNRKKRKL